MNTIRINRKELVEKLIDEEVNKINATGRNGGWQVHVFPGKFKQMESEIIDVKPFFHQNGNFYGHEVGHVCEFGIEAFFDYSGELGDRGLFDFNEERNRAKEEYLKDVRFNQLVDIDEDNLYDDLPEADKKAIEKKQDEWAENQQKYAEEIASANTINEINCEDAEGTILHTYKIEWV
jgi:hypothetical protein